VLNSIQYDRYNSVVYADVDNTVFATETRRQQTKNTFDQLVLTGEWKVTDKLTLDGHIGQETSDYDIPISDKFYTEAFGGLITDYRGDTGRTPTSGTPPTRITTAPTRSTSRPPIRAPS
jgi:iron complex outermembrane receptor protein